MAPSKYWIIRGLRTLGGRGAIKTLNFLVRKLASFTHRAQFVIEWGIAPNPEWYDHHLDQYYSWTAMRIPFCWERGIFNLLAMRQGAKVLELCCGDGFNAYHFYSIRADSIIAVDFDPEAIHSAKWNFRASNVNYQVADIRMQMPQGKFDNVIWDAAIEHFTEDEIRKLMVEIKARLTEDGTLSGYTIIESDQAKSHHEHEYEFKSKEDLLRFLTAHFRNARIFETIYPSRHNLYFFAGDAELPFDEHWPAQLVHHE